MLRRCVAVLIILGTASAAIASPKAKDETEQSMDSQDKIICKRFTETGSLVKATRVCKTKHEWERDRDDLRAARTGSHSGSCPSADAGCN